MRRTPLLVFLCTLAFAPASQSAAQQTPLEGRWLLTNTRDGRLRLELQWSDHTQWRREVSLRDLTGMPANALTSTSSLPVSLQIAREPGDFTLTGHVSASGGNGTFRFIPHHAFDAALRSLIINAPTAVRDHDLKNMAFGDVSSASIREFAALGLDSLSYENIVDLAVHQVHPDFVRSLIADGNHHLTVEQIIDYKMSGPRLVRR